MPTIRALFGLRRRRDICEVTTSITEIPSFYRPLPSQPSPPEPQARALTLSCGSCDTTWSTRTGEPCWCCGRAGIQ